MNRERLENLRRVVASVLDKDLFIQEWSKTTTCGTIYCVAGWAAVDPWFIQNTEISQVFSVRRSGTLKLERINPFVELARIFGISDSDTKAIFGHNTHNEALKASKADVIENIDRVLRDEPALPYQVLHKDTTSE